jgi:3-dehydroquinate dehydratase / shikimate dehydrogenase
MDTSLLCATVTASTTAGLIDARDCASGVADLVELRLDGVQDLDVQGALAGRRRPAIVTCRPVRERGRFDGTENERLDILGRAAALGAEYIDVEWDSAHMPLVARRGGRGVIVSSHDFDGVPADLAARFGAMRATGAEVVKIAVTARGLTDNLPLLALGRESAGHGRVALVAMGDSGVPSRILAGRFGSCWAYSGDAIAPGQMTPERMVSEFRFRTLTAASRVFGLVGRPVGHSVSPAMHNAAFDATGIDAVYLPFAARDVADFRAFADAIGVAGASVTAPFKQDALREAGEADEPARRCGAANTLLMAGGRWVARNADIDGFLDPIDLRGILLRGMRCAVFGTGGAARAVVVALAQRGALVTVYGRGEEGARRVAGLAEGGVARAGIPGAGTFDLLVNATPVGMWPAVDAVPMDPAVLSRGCIVYDLIYNPQRTALLRQAEAAGCVAIPGLEMLIAQAARQFEWWTGMTPPREVMRSAAVERLARMAGEA